MTNLGLLRMLDAYSVPSKQRASLVDLLSEIVALLSQAYSAAHLYDELIRKSDAALAERGLSRSDVPRIAYHELTKEL